MQYIASVYANRFRHPILAGILSVALGLVASATVLEMFAPFTIPLLGWGVPPIAAGFVGIFGILAGAIGLLAYGVLYVSRLISVFRDQTAPHRA